jgi:hypothetical protein
MKYLLLITLLAPLSAGAMFRTATLPTSKQEKLDHWVDTLEAIVREFNRGTLTKDRLVQDIVKATWSDDSEFAGYALEKKDAILAAVNRVFENRATASPQQLKNATAGLLFLLLGLSGADKLEIESLIKGYGISLD